MNTTLLSSCISEENVILAIKRFLNIQQPSTTVQLKEVYTKVYLVIINGTIDYDFIVVVKRDRWHFKMTNTNKNEEK